MWRLIVFIFFCAIVLVFIVFNLENKSDVSFGFHTFNDIPVFLTAFSSFVLGMLFAVPFVLSFGRRRKKPSPDTLPGEGGPKKWWGAKNKKPSDTDRLERDTPSSTNEIKKEDSPYGID